MKKIKYKKNKKGSVLVVTLILFGIIVITSLSVALSTLRQTKTSMQSSKTNIAYQNADEGIDKVMTALLKGKKSYNVVSKKIQINGVLNSGCVGGKITNGSEYAVELFDSSGNPVDCGSAEDIKIISQLKSTGNDNSLGTQRIVEANVPQKDSNIKFLLHADTTSGGSDFIDSSRVHHAVSSSGGAIIGTSSIAPISPNYGYANFDGNNDYLFTNEAADANDWELGTNPFTVDFWVNFRDDTGSGTQTIFQLDNNNSNILRLDYAQGSHAIGIYLFGAACGSFAWSSGYTNNQWYHFAVVREKTSGEIKLYIDGENKAISSCSNNASADLTRITVGSTFSGSQYFRGYIDEFRLFSDAYWTEEFKNDCPVDADKATDDDKCKPY